ncbi:MAG: hypothetical protein DRP87_09240 [Spirochaetes bacterium]|nr:MAG: hypothetical protein DRP87_09240 [Spirochaetota bacterium]
MRKRKLLLYTIFLLLYLLGFSRELDKELIFQPKWVVHFPEVDNTLENTPQEDEYFDFHLGDIFGYIYHSGKIGFMGRVFFNVEMLEGMFVNYSNVSENLIFKDTQGKILMNIETPGYPVLRDDRIFVIEPDRTGISEYDQSGSLLWKREYGTLITCMDTNDEDLLLGTLDGRIQLLGSDGSIRFQHIENESLYNVIYGCAINEDGSSLAVVSGVKPQRMELFQKGKPGYNRSFIKTLDTDVRRNMYIEFSSDGRWVFLEGDRGFYIVDSLRKGIDFIELSGNLKKMISEKKYGIHYLLFGNEIEERLVVFKPPGKILMDLPLEGEEVFLHSEDGKLFLGLNQRIMRIDVRKE